MIYSVNVKILKMLKDSRLAPVTKKSLEELLNATQVGQSLNTYLIHIQTWVEEVFDNFKEDKNHLRERIAHDVIYTSLYFYTLLAKHMTNPEIITGIKNDLQKFLDSYEANRQSFVLKNAFNAIKTAYCPRWDFYFQIKLKDDLTTDELVEIYNNWLDCNEELYEFIVFCEKYLHDLYDEDWKNNVFNPDVLRGASHKTQMLGESKDFIISFCESTSRYHSSRQKMISASLHDPISRNTYKGRTFGFMYRFSPDSIIGMSIADAESATFKMNDETSAISYVLQGTPVDSITKRYEICPIDFKPIYDFWKFRNKTYKYNEILLKEGTEPYGIFTFKESLEKDRTKIFAVCITYELPLFICDQTGNVRYIPLTDVIAVVEGRFPSMF